MNGRSGAGGAIERVQMTDHGGDAPRGTRIDGTPQATLVRARRDTTFVATRDARPPSLSRRSTPEPIPQGSTRTARSFLRRWTRTRAQSPPTPTRQPPTPTLQQLREYALPRSVAGLGSHNIYTHEVTNRRTAHVTLPGSLSLRARIRKLLSKMASADAHNDNPGDPCPDAALAAGPENGSPLTAPPPSPPSPPPPPSSGADEADHCWICHQGASAGPLRQHCGCKSMLAHDACLGHWQFRNCGTTQETKCRICSQPLPDWRHAATERAGRTAAKEVTLCIQVDGVCKWFKLKVGGPETIPTFRKRLKRAFNLSEHVHLDIDFTVQNPFTGDEITLSGISSYCAALHCGALSRPEGMPGAGLGAGSGAGNAIPAQPPSQSQTQTQTRRRTRTRGRESGRGRGRGRSAGSASATPPSGSSAISLLSCLPCCGGKRRRTTHAADAEGASGGDHV